MKKPNVNCKAVPITAGIVAGSSDPLLSEAYILPEQFFSQLNATQPEKRLMIAILEDAIHCLSYADLIDACNRRLAQEATEWFMSEEVNLPFAFVPICEVLNLNPDYLRARLFTVSPQETPRSDDQNSGTNNGKWHSTLAQRLSQRMGREKTLRKALYIPVGRVVAVLKNKKDQWREIYNLVFAFLLLYFVHPEQRIACVAKYLQLGHIYARGLRDVIFKAIEEREPLFFEVLFYIAEECGMDTNTLGILLSRLREGKRAA